jgi:rubrerythrin
MTAERASIASPSAAAVQAMHAARAAEKEQALFYRALAAQAEEAGDAEAVERLNGLHADEQHHLSRLSARLVELGEALDDLSDATPPAAVLRSWEAKARDREHDEAARYETLLQLDLDARTARMIDEFLDAERRHASALGGKWMQA